MYRYMKNTNPVDPAYCNLQNMDPAHPWFKYNILPMKKLLAFASIHFALLAFLIHREFKKDPCAYALFLAITQNNGLHLLHTCFLMLIIFASCKLLLHFLLDTVRPEEISTVNDNCFVFLTDVLLIVTIFNDDLTIKNLIIFSVLLAFKCLNWIVTERIKQVQNGRVVLLITILFILSLVSCVTSLHTAIIYPSLFILFAYEFGIVALYCFRNVMYCFISTRDESNRTMMVFVNDIIFIFARLLAVVSFFVFTAINFRIPFNLFREAVATMRGLYKKINQLYAYNRITRELNTCLDVENGGECPICFTNMDLGKKIWCGHVFHVDCLKKWVETSEVCPICRRGLFKGVDEVTFNAGDERITGIPIAYDR